MTSIYHLFRDVLEKRRLFKALENLEDFPYATELLACKNKGMFPDLAIKINTTGVFAGGDDVLSLPMRDVYYLVRGRKSGAQKIALVHGSFFETVSVDDLIRDSFSQVLQERMHESDADIPPEVFSHLSQLFSKQKNFSKVRHVEKASVKLRFRVMTEIKAEGNLLHPKQYPDILDNTINFVLPLHNARDAADILHKAELVFSSEQSSSMRQLKIKHHFNGWFFVFQAAI